MKKVWIVMAAVVLIAGCVSSKEYRARLSDIDGMKQDVSALKSRINALEQENATLKSQLKAAQDEKTALEGQLKAARDEKGSLGGRLNTAQDEKMILEARLKAAGNEKASLERRLNLAQEENASLEGRLKTLQAEKEALEAQLKKVQDEKDSLEARLKAVQDEKVALEARLRAMQDEKTGLEGRLKSTEEANALLQQENASLKSQVSDAKGERDTAFAEKDKAISGFKSTYDNLVNELQKEIKAGQIAITQLKDKLSLTMVEKVLFDSGRADIKPEGKKVLDRVGGILKQVTDKQITIEGHTDNVPISPKLQPKFPTNWELSTTRATNVVRYLQEKAGLDPRLLSATGSSEYHPVDSNESSEGRAKNRRIEIILVPLATGKTAQ